MPSSVPMFSKSLESKLFLKKPDGTLASWLHDICLQPYNAKPEVFNMVVEIPRHTHAKMEISMSVDKNPIIQDVKKGKLRFLRNVFPNYGVPFNYGALPMTFESPFHNPLSNLMPDLTSDEKALKGDKDPLDVVEIGSKIPEMGSVIQVKVITCLPMIDEGELDFKIIAINTEDPKVDSINSIEDIRTHFPGVLENVHYYFKYYKSPDVNVIMRDAKLFDQQLTLNLIEETHKAYINDFKIESVVRYDNEETKYPKEYKTFEDETMNTFLYVSQK